MEPDDRVRRVVQEPVAIVPYDPHWPMSFAREKEHLLYTRGKAEFIDQVMVEALRTGRDRTRR